MVGSVGERGHVLEVDLALCRDDPSVTGRTLRAERHLGRLSDKVIICHMPHRSGAGAYANKRLAKPVRRPGSDMWPAVAVTNSSM